MNAAYIALGSNLGDSKAMMHEARERIRALGHVRAYSRLYATRPWGFEHQPDFTNAALLLETEQAPLDVLQKLQAIEHALGKTFVCHNGPRCLDLDLIFFNDQILAHAQLTLPHPRAHQRDFVLAPLCDFAPDYRHPQLGKTLSELLTALNDRFVKGSTAW